MQFEHYRLPSTPLYYSGKLLTMHAPRVGTLIRRLHQRNQAVWSTLCIDPKITSVQTATLSILLDEGPISLSEIGVLASMDLATTRGVVDRLKAQNLITLVKDEGDKRKVIAELTAQGKSYVEAMLPVMDIILDKTLEPLNPAERLAFEFILRKILTSEIDYNPEIATDD
ncbi:hypothetical protein BZ163_11490 [Pseudomonas sp. VI4.1]|nr:hypothetical protein BZ163_11490 [Pseudomonas sp. VI4.1]